MIRHNGIEINTARHTIKHGARVVRSGYHRFTLLKHLILGYHDPVSLFELIYGHREDGGPIGGHHDIWIMLNQCRREVRELGLRLVERKDGRCFKQYHLKPIGDDI